MALTAKKNVVKRRRIEFALEKPKAQQVILMGDFNQWNPKTHPMRRDDEIHMAFQVKRSVRCYFHSLL
jgi:1,4-alpha-glucan branching enzyme